jgi:type 1 fimbria pilin
MKKSLIIVMGILMLSLAAAQDYKLGIEIKESFPPGEPITFKINIFDSSNNIVPGEINVEIEDAQKITLIERTVNSGELNTITIENARAGYWTISALYQDSAIKEFFNIETSEEVKFEIEGDTLIVKNTGNSRYTKTIDIIIGDSLGTKNVDLGVGEETKFRLIAPDGTYSIKVSDGKTTMAKSNIALTGNVIGVMDEKIAESKGSVTGGVKPEDELGSETFYQSIRNRSFVYVFILVVIGAAVLLAIERNYKRRI